MTRPVCEKCGTRETRRNVRLRPANDGCYGVHDPLWCDLCEAEWLCQHPEGVAARLAEHQRTLDAYERLWVRHGKLVAALRSLDREAEQRHALPSPHELRTGETREDVLRFYAEVRARQEGDQ